ncbi:MAG: ABC transporter ATP-binding protein [Wenzhouxiangella sp.]|nr:ABC transporter ATP-binding protein [Wenzhouxiangella sp.]MDR9452796.1 ABC transporter ATP-binding protein [Wenzhouxiangella sp.]
MTTQAHGAWPMLKHFVRAYPSRSVVVIVALVVASILDGLGLSMLLSMLNLATGETQDPSLPEQLALSFTESLGLTPDTAVLLGLGVGLIAVKAVFVLLANRQVGYTVAHVATDLRLNLIRAITNSQWRYYISQPVGRLSNALATEAQRASEGFYHGAVMATQFINALIFGALAMLISWQATLMALICGGALLGLLHTLIAVAGRAGRDQTSLLKQLLSVMTDQLGAIKPLKAMAREGHIDALMSAQTKDLKTALKSQVFSKAALIALQEPLLAILVAVGFFFFVVKMGMNMATVVVMIFLIARAINHLAKAQRAYQHIAISESAYWSLQETTDLALTQREPSQGQQTPTLDDGIVFQDVAFQYDQTPTLEGLNFAIPAHQLTVVTGPSGSGKTTVIDLVAGLLQPTSGEILVDGQPINDLDQRQWRRLIGYVPQEALLVNESVFYNLTLGDDTLTEADAHAALRMANAEHFIEQLEHGIHTPLGERGGRLSGGQRQRLAIARALIQQPKLLILDEATSNLDASSEQAIIETVDQLKGQLTLLAVSHDRPMIDIADQHIKLLGGQRQ